MSEYQDKLKKNMLRLQKKANVKIIKQLGQEIGYGQLMSLASAHWRAHLKQEGIPTSGAFIPTLIDNLKGKEKENAKKENIFFDNYIKKYSS